MTDVRAATSTVWCSCGWSIPRVRPHVLRVLVSVNLDEMVFHWRRGHDVSCAREARPAIEEAARALAARLA